MAKTEQVLQDAALRGISQCLRSVITANDGIDIVLDALLGRHQRRYHW